MMQGQVIGSVFLRVEAEVLKIPPAKPLRNIAIDTKAEKMMLKYI